MEKKEKEAKKKTTTRKKVDTKTKDVVAEEKAKEIEELREVKVEKQEKRDEKEVRKQNHKYESAKIQTEDQKEIMRFFIVFLVVVLMVTGIYFLTRIFVTKDLGKKKENTQTEEVVPGNVNYSVTSVGKILNRPYDSYYVLVYDTTNSAVATDAQMVMISYNTKDERKHLYTVDLSSYVNKDFYNKENENPEAKSVDEFKFGDLTLLYIKKGKVEKYITEVDKMKAELGIK